MKRKAILITLWVLLLLSAFSVWADYESGQFAWESGRPAEALVEWQTAADAGDRRAMMALGRLYLQGIGVLQNYVEAHKWFNLAASRGEMDAVAERDALAQKMTAEERAEAQKLALSWQPGASQSVETTPAATQSLRTRVHRHLMRFRKHNNCSRHWGTRRVRPMGCGVNALGGLITPFCVMRDCLPPPY